MLREAGNESILLNLDTGHYFGRDQVGARMWTVITTAGSIQAAYSTLLDECDVAPDVLQHDLLELIDTLQSHSLMKAT